MIKILVLVGSIILGWCAAGKAIGMGDAGAKEVKGKLQCSIQVETNSIGAGTRFLIGMTIENVGTCEAELPYPGCEEGGMWLKMFVVTASPTGGVQQLIIPSVVVPESVTAQQEQALKTTRAGDWQRVIQVLPQWITIPALTKQSFRILAEMSPKNYNGVEYGDVLLLPPGNYGLQCEIGFRWRGFMSQVPFQTNQWTSAEDIAKAKTDGRFLLDMHRLWTGKMDSNILPITLTRGQQ